MKQGTTQNQVLTTTTEYEYGTIEVTEWASMEGATVMAETPEGIVRMAASLRWEDIDALIVALASARARI